MKVQKESHRKLARIRTVTNAQLSIIVWLHVLLLCRYMCTLSKFAKYMYLYIALSKPAGSKLVIIRSIGLTNQIALFVTTIIF